MRYHATAMKRATARKRPVVELTFAYLLLLTLLLAPAHATAAERAADKSSTETTDGRYNETADDRYGQIPLHFQVNKGQAPANVNFLAKGNGYSIYLGLAETQLVLNDRGDVLRMRIAGANSEPVIEPQELLRAKVNYLRGRDASKWVRNVETYARAYYNDVYDGIDVVYYGTDQRQLEYDFVVAPGVDPSMIRLNFDGAEEMHVNEDGELVFQMSEGDLHMRAPYSYQETDGVRVEIESRYELLESGEVGFVLGQYDDQKTLVIDPVLVYGTYLGGSDADVVNDVAVDEYGQAYVVGYTKSGNFPTKNSIQFNNFFPGGSDHDIFVSKLAADGQTLIWSTYIGGSNADEGRGIAIDSDENVYITGKTASEDLPIFKESPGDDLDDELDGDTDAFLIKIDDDGDYLKYSTYYGGDEEDEGNDIDVDGDEAYIVGSTKSDDLRDNKNDYSEEWDAFVARFKDDGEVRWSKYVGGKEDDFGNDIALDSDDEPHIVGTTASDSDSDEFPITPGAIQSLYSGGLSDAFVAHLKKSSDDEFRYVTYLGGGDEDTGNGIDLDDDDDIYVVGQTRSDDFSGAGALHVDDNDLDGIADGYLVKLRFTGIDPLLYTNFVGGSAGDRAEAVVVDSQNRAHVVGTTASSDFPVTDGTSLSGANDAFLAIYENDGADIVFATYYGGTDLEDGRSIALDDVDDNYIVGFTKSDDLTTLSLQDDFGGGDSDGFIAKFGIKADLRLTKEVSNSRPLVGDLVTYTITVKNTGPDDVSLFDVIDTLPPGVVFESKDEGDFDCSGSEVVTCEHGFLASGASASFSITVEVRASTTIENCAAIDHPYQDEKPNNNERCATIVPQEQTTFWRNANTEAGTITALAQSDEVPPLKGAGAASGTIFAGADGGGVYRSTDGGDNWFPTAVIKTGKDVHTRGIAVDDLDGDVFVISFGRGIWWSDDLLETADTRNSGLSGSDKDMLSIVLNPHNPDDSDAESDSDIFVGTATKGVLKSEDDGDSWTSFNGTAPKELTNKTVRSLAIADVGHGTLGDLLFAGTHGGGVFRGWTKPVGGDWGAFNTGLGNLIVHALHLAADGTLYAGTNEGIYSNPDPTGSGTWTKETIFDPGYFVPEIVVRSFTENKDGDLFAGTDGDYVFVKRFGDTEWAWTGVLDMSGTMQYNLGFQSSTILALLAATDGAGGDDIVFAGTQDHGVHRFTEDDVIWEQVSNETLNAVIQAMTIVDVSGKHDLLFGGTYGFGVLMSDDFDSQPFVNWTQVNKGLSNQWVYALEQVERNNVNYVFAGTWNGGVFRSTDNGENWMFSGLANRIVYDIAINDDDVVFAATDLGEVARSVDQGLTWQEIGVATTAIWALGIESSHVIYAGTFGAGILKSEDGGISWKKTGMTSGHVFDFAFGENPETNEDGVFAATATGVKFSDDDGATWTDFSTGLTVPDTRSIAVHPKNDDLLLAATWGGGVFTYDKDAHSWVRDGLPQMPVTAFAIHPGTGEVFVGLNDGGLYRKTFASKTTVGTDDMDGELPAEFALKQNYPNPFNPTTNIEFALPEAQDVRLTIYDALGRQVEVLVDGTLSAGTHQVTFEASSLPSGVYFYRLDSAQQSIAHKMILMK